MTAKGLRFNGLYYSCPRAIAEHWFEKAGQTGSWKAPISFEPRLTNQIWLQDFKATIPFEPCTLTSRSEDFRSKTHWETDQIFKEDRKQRGKRQPAQRQARMDYNIAVEQIVQDAKAQRSTDDRPKTQRVKDIRQAHREERDVIRPREAFDLGQPKISAAEVVPLRAPQMPQKDSYDLPSIDAIRERLSRDEEEGHE